MTRDRRDLAVVALGALVAVRCVVAFAPDVHFDLDPAASPQAFPGLGPLGRGVLDAALALVALTVLALERRAGRAIGGGWIVAAVTPCLAAFVHGGDHLATGFGWTAAALAAVAAAHAAHDRGRRAALLALLAAGAMMAGARGVRQSEVKALGFVGAEHAAAIAELEGNWDRFLVERGWEPDGASARIFARRVRQAQPRGWFETTNVLGTLLAGAAAWCAAAALRRDGRPVPPVVRTTWALAGAGAAALMALGGAKAALLAAAGGLALVVLVRVDVHRRLARAWPWLLAAAPLGAIGAVVGRLVLPESFAGDLSVLFRGHYLVAAARMVASAPVAGVGPEGFAAAYLLHRVPRSPEEVSSAHDAFADWLATLGLPGLAWIGLALALAWCAGRRLGAGAVTTAADDGRDGPRAGLVLAAVLLVGALGVRLEAAALDGAGLAARGLGIVAGVVAALVVRGAARRADASWITVGTTAAAIVVLVHAQVEMTMTRPGAAAWCWVLLGVAAGPPRRPGGAAFARAAFGAALAVTLAGIAAVGPRQLAQARRVEEAAGDLRALGGALAEARHRGDERTVRDLERSLPAARRLAADRLVAAWEAWPRATAPLRAAIDQLLRIASDRGSDESVRIAALAHAETLATTLAAASPRDRAAASAVGALAAESRHRLDGSPEALAQALAFARELVAADPHGLAAARRRAELLWTAGDRAAARAEYRRALEIDAAMSLDPLKQLTAAQRAEAEARLAAPDEAAP